MSSGHRTPRRRRRLPVDRGPRPLSESLDDALAAIVPPRAAGTADERRSAPPSADAWGAVFSRWEEIVGAALARHARPLRLDGTTLVVAVDLPPWATQIRALGPGILRRVGEIAGDPPRRLEVVVRPFPDR